MNNEMDDFSTPNVTNSFGYKPSPVSTIIFLLIAVKVRENSPDFDETWSEWCLVSN